MGKKKRYQDPGSLEEQQQRHVQGPQYPQSPYVMAAGPTYDNRGYYPPAGYENGEYADMKGYNPGGRLPTHYHDHRDPRFRGPDTSTDDSQASLRDAGSKDSKRRMYMLIGLIVVLVLVVTAVVGAVVASQLSKRKGEDNKPLMREVPVNKTVYATTTLVDKEFTPALADKTSQEYKNVESDFKAMMDNSFQDSEMKDEYVGVEIEEIRSGSLIIDFQVIFIVIAQIEVAEDGTDVDVGVDVNTLVTVDVTVAINIIAKTQGTSGSAASAIDNCQSSPCDNGGTCTSKVNKYDCACVPGYTGQNCSTNIDECSSSSCENGGQCRDGVNKYTCVCATGFNGVNCENNIDNCIDAGCVQDQTITCIDGTNAFTCVCKPGYTGTLCETDINECESAPCQNGGACNDEVNKYSCSCLDGYSGQDCEEDIDECAPKPCQNEGTCSDLVNGYTCTCLLGYEGDNCEIDINECSSSPCQHGGTCSDEVNGYTCECMLGYIGTDCETDIDDCAPNPCKNGGRCYDKVNDYDCVCDAGYTDKNCETNIDECVPDPCLNGGSCTDKVSAYECKCAAGYEGTNCETNINDCDPNPCENGGTCTDEVNGFLCTCMDGFQDDRCQTDIDDCKPNPCTNGGACTDKVNGYSCSCARGFEGDTCLKNIDDCSNNPCENGGTCVDGINSFTCRCVTGYNGDMCETNIDDCFNNPCENGGSCVDGINSFTCRCVTGYNGDMCETNIDDCASQPCEHGGTCMDEVDGYSCECTDGFAGFDCEVDIDECMSNPCQNGGSCSNEINGYTCSCPGRYSGVACEMDFGECWSSPCQNGGSCFNDTNGYTCSCPGRFAGKNCETEITTVQPTQTARTTQAATTSMPRTTTGRKQTTTRSPTPTPTSASNRTTTPRTPTPTYPTTTAECYWCFSEGNITCVPTSWICDGYRDCDDGSDENCNTTGTYPTWRTTYPPTPTGNSSTPWPWYNSTTPRGNSSTSWPWYNYTTTPRGTTAPPVHCTLLGGPAYFDVRAILDEGYEPSRCVNPSPAFTAFEQYLEDMAVNAIIDLVPGTNPSDIWCDLKLMFCGQGQSNASTVIAFNVTVSSLLRSDDIRVAMFYLNMTAVSVFPSASGTTTTPRWSTTAQPTPRPTSGVTCSPNEFQCSTGRCIPIYYVCDYERDCPGGEDEDDFYCRCTGTRCANNKGCYSEDQRCDSYKDCLDGSDEVSCPLICQNYTCANEVQCYSEAQRCNGIADCADGSDEWLTCSPGTTISPTPAAIDIQLVSGSTGFSTNGSVDHGRVEVRPAGSAEPWGTICHDMWDSRDAQVVCRMLGFTNVTAYAYKNGFFGAGDLNAPIYMSNIHCNGDEDSLLQCRFSGWGEAHCHHSYDASVSCGQDFSPTTTTQTPSRTTSASSSSTPNTTNGPLPSSRVRLTNGSSCLEGRVEVFQPYQQRWVSVCPYGVYSTEANVVCKSLGFQYYYRYDKYTYPAYPPHGLFNLDCSGYETNLFDCRDYDWSENGYCSYSAALSVTCRGDPLIDCEDTSEPDESCDFDNGRCGYNTSMSQGNASWFFTSENQNRLFMYTNPTGSESDSSRLQSPVVTTEFMEAKLEFNYNLQETSYGNLRVQLLDPETVTEADVWASTYLRLEEEYTWSYGCVNLNLTSDTYAIAFDATRSQSSSFKVMLDNVTVSQGKCTDALLDDVCDFDAPSLCNMVVDCEHCQREDKVFRWWWTADSRYPQYIPIESGNFMYADTSYGREGDEAWMTFSIPNLIDRRSFSFDLYMVGEGVGSLHVYVYKDGNEVYELWSQTTVGELNAWVPVCVALPESLQAEEAHDVRFKATLGTNLGSFIAVDSIRMSTEQNCPHAITCNKLKATCGWTVEQEYRSFTWTLATSVTQPKSHIRLVGGATEYEGDIQYFYNGEWRAVCDDGFGISDATVVCKMLGSKNAITARTRSYYGNNWSAYWLDDLNCRGTEEDIADCGHSSWGYDNCGSSENAGAECAEPESIPGGESFIKLTDSRAPRGSFADIISPQFSHPGGEYMFMFDQSHLENGFLEVWYQMGGDRSLLDTVYKSAGVPESYCVDLPRDLIGDISMGITAVKTSNFSTASAIMWNFNIQSGHCKETLAVHDCTFDSDYRRCNFEVDYLPGSECESPYKWMRYQADNTTTEDYSMCVNPAYGTPGLQDSSLRMGIVSAADSEAFCSLRFTYINGLAGDLSVYINDYEHPLRPSRFSTWQFSCINLREECGTGVTETNLTFNAVGAKACIDNIHLSPDPCYEVSVSCDFDKEGLCGYSTVGEWNQTENGTVQTSDRNAQMISPYFVIPTSRACLIYATDVTSIGYYSYRFNSFVMGTNGGILASHNFSLSDLGERVNMIDLNLAVSGEAYLVLSMPDYSIYSPSINVTIDYVYLTEQPCEETEMVCNSRQFTCELSQECVESYQLCDGRRDCVDGSDEKNCTCYSNTYIQCEMVGCFHSNFFCDGVQDCLDGTDESFCDDSVSCTFRNMTCGYSGHNAHWQYNSSMIINSLFGYIESPSAVYVEPSCFQFRGSSYNAANIRIIGNFSGSCQVFGYDQSLWYDPYSVHSVSLPVGEYSVILEAQSTTFYSSLRVNVYAINVTTGECPIASNRTTTPRTPTPTYPTTTAECYWCFSEGNITCVPTSWICDGYMDCDDGSDENCNTTGTYPTWRTTYPPTPTECGFRCRHSGACVSIYARCDGEVDCDDGSDEQDCSSTTYSNYPTSTTGTTYPTTGTTYPPTTSSYSTGFPGERTTDWGGLSGSGEPEGTAGPERTSEPEGEPEGEGTAGPEWTSEPEGEGTAGPEWTPEPEGEGTPGPERTTVPSRHSTTWPEGFMPIMMLPSVTTAYIGSPVDLICELENVGDQQVTMSWWRGYELQVAYEDDIMLDEEDAAKYSVSRANNADTITYTLTINDVEESDNEVPYVCKADIVAHDIIMKSTTIQIDIQDDGCMDNPSPLCASFGYERITTPTLSGLVDLTQVEDMLRYLGIMYFSDLSEHCTIAMKKLACGLHTGKCVEGQLVMPVCREDCEDTVEMCRNISRTIVKNSNTDLDYYCKFLPSKDVETCQPIGFDCGEIFSIQSYPDTDGLGQVTVVSQNFPGAPDQDSCTYSFIGQAYHSLEVTVNDLQGLACPQDSIDFVDGQDALHSLCYVPNEPIVLAADTMNVTLQSITGGFNITVKIVLPEFVCDIIRGNIYDGAFNISSYQATADCSSWDVINAYQGKMIDLEITSISGGCLNIYNDKSGEPSEQVCEAKTIHTASYAKVEMSDSSMIFELTVIFSNRDAVNNYYEVTGISLEGDREGEGILLVERDDGQSGTLCSYIGFDTASMICQFLGFGSPAEDLLRFYKYEGLYPSPLVYRIDCPPYAEDINDCNIIWNNNCSGSCNCQYQSYYQGIRCGEISASCSFYRGRCGYTIDGDAMFEYGAHFNGSVGTSTTLTSPSFQYSGMGSAITVNFTMRGAVGDKLDLKLSDGAHTQTLWSLPNYKLRGQFTSCVPLPDDMLDTDVTIEFNFTNGFSTGYNFRLTNVSIHNNGCPEVFPSSTCSFDDLSVCEPLIDQLCTHTENSVWSVQEGVLQGDSMYAGSEEDHSFTIDVTEEAGQTMIFSYMNRQITPNDTALKVVFHADNGSESVLFSDYDAKSWFVSACVEIPDMAGHLSFVLSTSRLGGSIVIDDVGFQAERCPHFASCDFEDTTCNYVIDSYQYDFHWNVSRAGTWFFTDHTLQMPYQGHYLEIVDYVGGLADPAPFSLPRFQLDGNYQCLSFYYSKVDQYDSARYQTPQLKVMTDLTDWEYILPETETYQAGSERLPEWLEVHYPLVGEVGDFVTINFTAVKRSPYKKSLLALDDFEILQQPCISGIEDMEICNFSQPILCNYEAKALSNSGYQWRRYKTNITLPLSLYQDGGSDVQGYFMMVDSSMGGEGHMSKLAFNVESPNSDLQYYQFTYQMVGQNAGTLSTGFEMVAETEALVAAADHTIETRSVDVWQKSPCIAMPTGGPGQIGFLAERGSSLKGDIALDNVQLLSSCLEPSMDCDFTSGSDCHYIYNKEMWSIRSEGLHYDGNRNNYAIAVYPPINQATTDQCLEVSFTSSDSQTSALYVTVMQGLLGSTNYTFVATTGTKIGRVDIPASDVGIILVPSGSVTLKQVTVTDGICTAPDCGADEVVCRDQCLPASKRCDRIRDCRLAEDEAECGFGIACTFAENKCGYQVAQNNADVEWTLEDTFTFQQNGEDITVESEDGMIVARHNSIYSGYSVLESVQVDIAIESCLLIEYLGTAENFAIQDSHKSVWGDNKANLSSISWRPSRVSLSPGTKQIGLVAVFLYRANLDDTRFLAIDNITVVDSPCSDIEEPLDCPMDVAWPCADNRLCYTDELSCDGESYCLDGSDETGDECLAKNKIPCDFEDDNLCGYTMSGNVEVRSGWLHQFPAYDKTTGNESGHFLYVSNWKRYQYENPEFTSYFISSPTRKFAEDGCITFWYILNGTNLQPSPMTAQIYVSLNDTLTWYDCVDHPFPTWYQGGVPVKKDTLVYLNVTFITYTSHNVWPGIGAFDAVNFVSGPCPAKPDCRSDKHQCENSDLCIPEAFVCDGFDDCVGGTEEKYCDKPDGAFTLLDGESYGELRYFHNQKWHPVCYPTTEEDILQFDQTVTSHVCNSLNYNRGNRQSYEIHATYKLREPVQLECSNNGCNKTGSYYGYGCNYRSKYAGVRCSNSACFEGEALCPGSRTKCIAESFFCDGRPDCDDNRDEEECYCRIGDDDNKCTIPGYKCVNGEQCEMCKDRGRFECKNHLCLDRGFLCDGINDCGDYSDEYNCVDVKANQPVRLFDRGTADMKPVCLNDIGKAEADMLCQLAGQGYIGHAGIQYGTQQVHNGMILTANDNGNHSQWVFDGLYMVEDDVTCYPLELTCETAACGSNVFMDNVDYAEPMIINGRTAVPGQFPHQCALWALDGTYIFYCGCSYLGGRWALTAGHCVEFNTDYKVVFGTMTGQTMGEESHSQVITVKRAHHRYVNYLQGNDVAMLELDWAPRVDNYTRPVCLGTPESYQRLLDLGGNAECIVSGYGNDERVIFTGDPDEASGLLTYTPVGIIPRDICEPWLLRETVRLSPDAVCVQNADPYIEACNGDSGGPLACRNDKGLWELIGDTSYGLTGCFKFAPVVYCSIPENLDWIQGYLGRE